MKTGLDDGVPLKKCAINAWRDKEIAKLYSGGLSLREIANHLGDISHEGVRAAIERSKINY